MQSSGFRRVAFGPYVLDRGSRELLYGSMRRRVPLSRKGMDLLILLAARRPHVVAKAVIFAEVWPKTFVSDVTLASVVAEIRRALRESSRRPKYIRTVHRVGYAFPGTAHEVDPPVARLSARCALVWGAREWPLVEGEQTVGRSRQAAIRLESRRVSRHHARITATRETVDLTDLGSKNRTLLNGTVLVPHQPQRLADGDRLRFGPFTLTLRALDGTTATATQPA